MTDLPTKVCATCGRTFTWRKKWQRSWDDVRYCAKACRRGLRPIDTALETTILDLLQQRARGATICPSEAARLVDAEQVGVQIALDETDSWRALMEPARQAARRLVAAGSIEITQKGVVVDPSSAKGPIRLRLRRSS